MFYPANSEEAVRAEATLFIAAADWDSLTDLIIKYAPSMMPAEGNKTLQRWLLALPEHLVAENAWLLYWRGRCCLSSKDLEARACLEKAFELFRRQGTAEGMYLTWADIVDTYSLEFNDWRPLDKWLAELDVIMERYPLPSPAIELRVATSRFCALVSRMTAPAEIKRVAEKIVGLRQEADIGNRLQVCLFSTIYHIFTGNYPSSALLFQELKQEIIPKQSSPLTMINLRLLEAMHYLLAGEGGLCEQAVAAGLRIAKASGIHTRDSLLLRCRAENAMFAGNREQIRGVLAALNKKRIKTVDHIYYHTLSAWQALLDARINDAHDHLRECEGQVGTLGSPYHESRWHIGMAQVLMAKSELGAVMAHLDAAFVIARKIKSIILMYAILLLYARLFFIQGEKREGVAYLRQALLVGWEHGYMHFPWWQSEIMADLCGLALENDIEIDYVRELIRRRGLTPAAPSKNIETWPWPLKIHTLGSLEIIRDGVPLVFTGKIQKKPLELLKALIAFGGQDVPEGHLIAALWPDTDGDYARHSLETALYRLRRMLGNKEMLILKTGRLSFDQRYCWIDTGAFEYLCNAIEKTCQKRGARQDAAAFLRLLEKACALYKGRFLPDAAALSYTVRLRERLRNRFRKIIVIAGKYWESQEQWDKAIVLYQRAIETDWLAEELYQRLMICQQKQGQTAEAVVVYRRLVASLSRRLDLAPSSKTDAIYRKIVKKKQP